MRMFCALDGLCILLGLKSLADVALAGGLSMLAGHAQSRSEYEMRLREIWIDFGRFFEWFHRL